MRKVLLLTLALTLGFGVKSQCPLGTAVDFTATDCHGTEVHLFDILDGGQYVLIDFFYYNCSTCNQTAPYLAQAYSALGCNMHDVFFMEISDRDSDALCQAWTNNYGIEYPTISGAAGGSEINDQYGISSYPTIILIAPDHSIVIHDLWPINDAQTVINALEAHGIEQHDCTTVAIEEDLVPITLFPNPANESVTLKGENLGTICVFNALGQKMDEFETNGTEFTLSISHYANGVYFIKAGPTAQRLIIQH